MVNRSFFPAVPGSGDGRIDGYPSHMFRHLSHKLPTSELHHRQPSKKIYINQKVENSGGIKLPSRLSSLARFMHNHLGSSPEESRFTGRQGQACSLVGAKLDAESPD